jgi:hypothetical protein
MSDDKTRQCPFCKEQINAEATKCKHCGSRTGSPKPGHNGICPFCKESIDPSAVICKHCRSNFLTEKDCGCVESPDTVRKMTGRRLAGRLSGFGVDGGGCESWCVGSTLMCACPVNIPGYGQGIVIYPCGTCIDDPVFTA